MRISFPKSSFDHFYSCPLDTLDGEISRTNIRMKLQDSPQTAEERLSSQEELDKLTVLKHISQLRKGKMSPTDFGLKVELL